MQISAELDERTWGMDFNADGDTNDLIPRLPDTGTADDDSEWLDTPGGLVVGSKDFGNTDFSANISDLSVPLFSYKDLLQSSAAATDLQKLRDASRANAYINFYWNIRTAEQLDRLTPADSDPTKNRLPPSLPSVAVPSVAGGLQSSHNPREESMMFNAQIVVDKQAGCWAVEYDRPPEIQCADGTDTCFTGHDFEYLTSVFTEGLSIVFRYPNPEFWVVGGSYPVGRVLPLAGLATESGETVTCGAITGPLGLRVAIVPAPAVCEYSVTPDSAIHGPHFLDIQFSSTSGAERTIKIPVHVSNIQFTPPAAELPIGGTGFGDALTPTDGKFAVTCGDNTGPLPCRGFGLSRAGCEYTLSDRSDSCQPAPGDGEFRI